MNDVVKCPNCGEEMKRGNIKLAEGIGWRSEKNADVHGSREVLRSGVGARLWPIKFEGWLCRECKLLLLSYEEK